MIQSSIFKSYDIRGIYPDQLNEATAFEIGRGFVKHAQVKNVLVGHDGRLSSPELFRALCEGIISLGANVISLGQVPTELVYFAIGNYDYDGAIMITASHNPKEYNGFKMMKKVCRLKLQSLILSQMVISQTILQILWSLCHLTRFQLKLKSKMLTSG